MTQPNNGYDSLKSPLSNLELAIINLANQHYNRDLAEKSKSAKIVKQKRGEYLAHAPFGYKKSDTVKNKLVPDDEAAGYVKLIFSLAVEGKRTIEIAQILNAQGIPSPSVYKVRNGWSNMWTQVIDPDYCFWTNGVIYKLLKNEVYLGKAVSNKVKVAEHGKTHTIPRSKDEWIIVPDAHEPLVSESDFQKAQLILQKKRYHGIPENIFGNKIKCSACGHAMSRYTKQNPRFKCGTAKLTSHYGCQSYSILQSEIEKALLAFVKVYVSVLIDKEQLRLSLLEQEKVKAGNIEKNIREASKTIQTLESSMTKLYFLFLEGKMTQEVYQQKKEMVKQNLFQKQEAVNQMEELLKTHETGCASIEESLSKLTPILSVETLDKELIDLLVAKILVHGEKDVEIVWNGVIGDDLA